MINEEKEPKEKSNEMLVPVGLLEYLIWQAIWLLVDCLALMRHARDLYHLYSEEKKNNISNVIPNSCFS